MSKVINERQEMKNRVTKVRIGYGKNFFFFFLAELTFGEGDSEEL